ncbi:hypothetical protein [Kitasatospora sp. A2-31]|uniref:hypothetical protein n=1 Tax=Kitasatospora sp. A2-31 TaxID=2916414 RepID=UPI001EE9BC78|nr:hypothetical protein [Kitasatospora sp. A2-31]MCG6496645.1 hypothetical protein [Kitasatospora sp. A2-31]
MSGCGAESAAAVPAWLEDVAHDQLVKLTAQHLRSASASLAAAQAARAEADRLRQRDGSTWQTRADALGVLLDVLHDEEDGTR